MLSPTDLAKTRAAYEATVDLLGVPATWVQTKAPNATADTVAGFKTVSWNDQELINAYGIGAKILTVKVSDIAVIEKFDTIAIKDSVGTVIGKYTIDAVMPVHLNGIHIFNKCVSKGK